MSATLTYKGRLPGVVCQSALPPRGEMPLRLDVAAFVGLAERGPLNTPVAVEDISQYRALFGGDIAVARDGGRPVYAHLPAAVRAFFDNGGRRCYVVRVAGAGARANRFRLPGLVAWDDTAGYRSVVAPAAWAGRWSDRLTLSTQLRVRPLLVYPGASQERLAGPQLILELPATTDVRAGDLLRVSFDGAERPWMLFPIREMRRIGTAPASTRGAPFLVAADPALVRAFRRSIGVLPEPLEVERLGEEGWEPVAGLDESPPGSLRLSDEDGETALTLPNGAGVAAGDVLRVTCDGGDVLLFPVDGLSLARTWGSPPDVSPPAGLPDLLASTESPLWEGASLPPSPPGELLLAGVRQVDLLRFDLSIAEGNEAQEPWLGLRFGPGAGYWADALAVVPPDPADEADGPAEGASGTPGEGVPAVEALAGRSLRLRAPAAARASRPPLFLPIGMALLPDPDLVAGPLPEAGDGPAAGKDGLDEFDPAELFLDSRLRGYGAGDLIGEAEYLLYLGQPPAHLAGLHSLAAVDEIGLIALPDLAHRAWGPPQPMPIPEVKPPPAAAPPDWSQFQNCPTPPPPVTLTPAQVVAGFLQEMVRGDEVAARDYLAPELLLVLDPAASLLALLGLERAPLSFEVEAPPCKPVKAQGTVVRATLLLVSGACLPVLFRLTWDGVQWSISSVDPHDADAQPVTDALRELVKLPVVEPPAAFRDDPARLEALLEVQDALVNLAAGRRDLVAVLSLPEHFERRDVLDWQRRALVPGEGLDPTGLSYAVLYHPWIRAREEVTPELALLRSEPADGAVCGVIAARELSRGPWIAPAGVPFLGVVGLAQGVGEADHVSLFDAQVNVLYQQPGQFTQMSAHTLSADRLLLQLSVRRLLIYLRKLVLRRGMEYAFEPNNERFRRRVEAGLERTLDALVASGGVAAYQVVTGEGLNTPNDVENGRFIVAVKVAPTSPIEFITVALLRSGEGLLQVLEV